VARRDGRLFHDESLLLEDASEFETASFPLAYRVGSGHFGRTYLCDAGDSLFVESPVTWYEPQQQWGMSPGYDRPIHQSFGRLVSGGCLFCHAGLVETSTASEFRMQIVENSIGCERCHGPGRTHVEEQTGVRTAAGDLDNSIVNPRNLSRKLSEAICQQCHLQGDIQVKGTGVSFADYRPGLSLEKYQMQFRMQRGANEMTIVGHVEQLAESACYRQSPGLTCTTCHDPHIAVLPAQKTGRYRSICTSCHGEQGCKLPLADRQEKSADDCSACHMPRAATEVPHVAFTHHHIGIHPLNGQRASAAAAFVVPLSNLSELPKADRDRGLALARANRFLRLGPAVQRSAEGEEFARQIDEQLGQLPEVAVDAAVEVARAEFSFVRGDIPAAIQAAERALEFDDIGTDETARALGVLGFIDVQQNRFREARHHYARLTRLRRNARDWYYLGISDSNCGNAEAAIEALEKSREIDRSNEGTYEALAAIHHARKDFGAEKRLRDDIARLKRWVRRDASQPE
jgi:predicted CXXCH cytochrome family protein